MSKSTEIGIRNSLLSEIKRLQIKSSIRLEIKTDGELTWLSTKYWSWYPYQFKECHNADKGDLFLGEADYWSGNIEEMIEAFTLLKKLIFFVQEYKPDFKDLTVDGS